MSDWLPSDWVHPTRADLPTGHHLRPIRAADVDLDYVAVMGGWVAERWPLSAPRYVGRDLTWAQYLALPELARP